MPTKSFNMLPGSAHHNPFDRLLMHVKLPSKRPQSRALIVLLSNIAYLISSQSRLLYGFAAQSALRVYAGMVLITAWQAIGMGNRSMASLCCHIVHIIGVRAQEQMIRAHARRCVAGVANLYSWWNIAIRQFPGNAMGKALAIDHPYFSIPLVVATASPQPASVSFVNLRPQPIFKRAHAVLIRAKATAINLSGIVGGIGARAVGAGFVVYNSHVGSSFQAIGHATAVSAARGFLMPNYTTKPPERHTTIINALGLRHVPVRVGVKGSEVVYS